MSALEARLRNAEATHAASCLALEDARRALRDALATQACRAWWERQAAALRWTDGHLVEWVVRRRTPRGAVVELELVRPFAVVRLRGEADPRAPRRRLADHYALTHEEVRRVTIPGAPLQAAPERVRMAAGDHS